MAYYYPTTTTQISPKKSSTGFWIMGIIVLIIIVIIVIIGLIIFFAPKQSTSEKPTDKDSRKAGTKDGGNTGTADSGKANTNDKTSDTGTTSTPTFIRSGDKIYIRSPEAGDKVMTGERGGAHIVSFDNTMAELQNMNMVQYAVWTIKTDATDGLVKDNVPITLTDSIAGQYMSGCRGGYLLETRSDAVQVNTYRWMIEPVVPRSDHNIVYGQQVQLKLVGYTCPRGQYVQVGDNRGAVVGTTGHTFVIDQITQSGGGESWSPYPWW